MITRMVRWQLVAFVLVTLLGVGYVSVRYLGAAELFGTGHYAVTLQLIRSGGIFTGADVTYRGVSVGRVGALRLTRDGVEAQLEITGTAPPIPADLDAAVTDLSVIGEQFVDLRPVRADGPMLHGGSVIPASRVSTPVPVEDLVGALDTFVRSVPLDSLRTVVTELDTGFTGTGPQLQRLLDSGDAVTRDAVAALPPTLTLIRDATTVLRTQHEQADAITSFSRDLALLGTQLQASDPDLRRLIGTAPEFAAQAGGLIDESGPQLGVLAADLLTLARVTLPRQDGLRQVLSLYPVLATAADTSIFPGDGFAHFGMVLNAFDPYACVRGYEGTVRRSGTDTAPIPVNRQAHCAEPPGSPINVRGARNVPRAGVPEAVAPGRSGPSAAPATPPGRPLDSLASILEGRGNG